MPDGRSPVPYEAILVDSVSGFDETKTVYKVKSSGFYFIHLSAGVPAYQRLNYLLRNGTSEPSILLMHASFDGELVTSRDDVQYLSENPILHVSSDYSLYSDGMLLTSWSGFNVDKVMENVVLFRAARTSPYTIEDSYIPLDVLLINIGQGWDRCNSQFIAPLKGVYFLSWSSASVPNTVHVTQLNINDALYAWSFIWAGYFNGSDTTSQSMLIKVNAGDTARLGLIDGPVYSDFNYQTSFSGFLYTPKHGQNVAWTFSFASQTDYLLGPSIVNFTQIIVDESNAWNSSSATFSIPVSGTYYLKLSGVSWPVEYKFNLMLSVNDKLLMNVIDKVDTVRNFTHNLRSRALITRLQEGDRLLVTVPAGYSAYTLLDLKYITLSGFLIQPDLIAISTRIPSKQNKIEIRT